MSRNLVLVSLLCSLSPWLASATAHACTFRAPPPVRGTARGDVTISVAPQTADQLVDLSRGAAIHVVIENYGAEMVTVRPRDFSVAAASGARCAAGPAAADEDLPAVRLPPGTRVFGLVRFSCLDVEAGDVVLRWQGRESRTGRPLDEVRLPLPDTL